MTAFIGRQISLTWNGVIIPGVQEKGITLNGEPIDISSDDSSGWRQLLEEIGDGVNNASENQVDIDISGVTKSDALMRAWFERKRTGIIVVNYPTGRIISGKFNLGTYKETGNYKSATTFEGSLQSSGEAVYTPEP